MRHLIICLTISVLFYGFTPGELSIEVVELPDASTKNEYYLSNKEPLRASPLSQIPLGDIKASGWLSSQLELMIDGYTGHLYEISEFLSDNSGWLGGDERGWEEAPYWLRGFYDLSVLTENERIDSVAESWIEAVVRSQDTDGYYGSGYNKMVVSESGKDSLPDLWPHMVMNDVLISHYEATSDKRVIPMLINFFKFCSNLPDDLLLPKISWDYYESYKEHFGDWKPRIQLKRAGDFVPQVYWLYNQTGEGWLLDFALRVYQKTQPAMNQWLDNHVVHFAQRFRYPAQMYPLLQDSFYLKMTNFFYDQFILTWGHFPRGGYAADEFIRSGKVDPRQGFESCAIVEGNKSFYILGNITGDTRYADKVEDLTFNWLPASTTPDLKAVRYLTAANMAYSVPHMDFWDGGEHPVFSAGMHRCCQHNTAMGWPWFIKNMWKASPDNGIVAWLYGPNELKAKVGKEGTAIKVLSSTDYPFKDKVLFSIKLEKPVIFPYYLRVPGWANQLTISINGSSTDITGQAGRYVKINREWQNGDELMVVFHPKVKLNEWPRTKSVTVDRGPLSYSVYIKEDWVRTPPSEGYQYEKWELHPGSAWNYGVLIDGLSPEKDIKVEVSGTMPSQPWDAEIVPISLTVPAKKIPGWAASIKKTIDPLREGPVKSEERPEQIKMIPMGAAHLRLTCLPVISESKNARYWEDIPDPNVFMLDRIGN